MAKYRLLTSQELKLFEKEFIEYLVVNGIAADDWKRIKEEEQEKANKIIDLFSDVVFEQVTRMIKVVEKLDAAVIQYIQCLEDKMELIAIKRKKEEIDLSSLNLDQIKFEDVDLIKGSKPYIQAREIEVFNLIVKGYQPSNEDQWNDLSQRLANI